jgi:peptidyl-prolyl cis-trans isomerase D
MVQKLGQDGKLADEAASLGSKLETASNFKREDSPPGVPSGLIAAAFRTAKDGAGQTPASGGTEWIVFRVTDIKIPPVDFNSDDMKKLKDQLVRGLSDEQVALYVAKLEKNIGTSINEEGLAQVTGAASN